MLYVCSWTTRDVSCGVVCLLEEHQTLVIFSIPHKFSLFLLRRIFKFSHKLFCYSPMMDRATFARLHVLFIQNQTINTRLNHTPVERTCFCCYFCFFIVQSCCCYFFFFSEFLVCINKLTNDSNGIQNAVLKSENHFPRWQNLSCILCTHKFVQYTSYRPVNRLFLFKSSVNLCVRLKNTVFLYFSFSVFTLKSKYKTNFFLFYFSSFRLLFFFSKIKWFVEIIINW